ncbi:MAG: hypothetical protein WCY88_03105 [Spongiibacteraceae bacterium]
MDSLLNSIKGTLSLVLMSIIFISSPASATIDPLDNWSAWVLKDHPSHDCPWLASAKSTQLCIWPGRLKLLLNSSNKPSTNGQAIDQQGMSFAQQVEVFGRDNLIALPGDQNHWPQAVTINHKPAPVIERNGKPFLMLSAGSYTINGKFIWQQQPSHLAIPETIALISLSKDGQPQVIDLRGEQLLLSPQSQTSSKQTRDSLSIKVFRKLQDGIPLSMQTVVQLSVSGKPRTVRFGKVMLANSEIVSIQSPIPARVEANGDIRAQLTPGEHSIYLLTRFNNNPEALRLPGPSSPEWPPTEYISFEADSALRQLKLTGASSIDTSQIPLPPQWLELPTYKMDQNTTLMLQTEYRGDHSPAANELNIRRDLWLDFDGSGLTSLDKINGSMYQGWRLNAAADTHIGRATVGDEAVLITQLDHDKQEQPLQGIEIRSPAINLSAISRIDSPSEFSAIGWQARVESFNATLHLPPGWRVLHASGLDQVYGTWISQWDLWDIFLMLIIVAATRKLFDNRVAALAAITFVLALQEPTNPLLLVPGLLIVLALLPIVTRRLQFTLNTTGALISLALLLSLLNFAVDSFRLAIYPSLERASVGQYHPSTSNAVSSYADVTMASDNVQMTKRERLLSSPQKAAQLEGAAIATPPAAFDLYQLADSDRVQTGPGLPTWIWNSIQLSSSGPVAEGQILSLIYSPAWLTALWRIASVLFAGLYIVVIIRRFIHLLQQPTTPGAAETSTPTPDTKDENHNVGNTASSPMLIVLLSAALSLLHYSPTVSADEYPPEYLLKKLEQRLTQPPACLPACVSLNQGMLNIANNIATISFDAYAQSAIAIPLPDARNDWQLLAVSDNDKQASLNKTAGNAYLQLAPGHHQIVLTAKLSSDQAAIYFPLPIHNFSSSTEGWLVEGLVNGRIRSNTLTLRNLDKNLAQPADTLKAEPISAFFAVKRRFSFGKEWRVQTTVIRHAPDQGAIAINLPLLDNEQVLSDAGTIKDGAITLQLGQQQRSVSFNSSMQPTSALKLLAASGTNYVEEWQFTPSSQWRLNYQGIPPTKNSGGGNTLNPTFRPWPGEALNVAISKPDGVAGPTHTIEKASLDFISGKQLQKSTLVLDIQASIGEDYTFSLPQDAQVLSLTTNNRKLNLPSGNTLTIPLQPGQQQISVVFQQLNQAGISRSTPVIELGTSATNLNISYTLASDRWPLFISGPAIGPAMLYWGVLCVIIIAAIALPYTAKALSLSMPITLSGWLLLGIGLSTVNNYGVLVVALFFFLLAARKQFIDPEAMSRFMFNALQVFIIGWGLLTAINIISAIPLGLLSSPEMQVVGNGSYSHLFNFYQDIVANDDFPVATVISLPLLAYRIIMLLWSLWLATKLIQWASWGWQCFVEKSSWKAKISTSA